MKSDALAPIQAAVTEKLKTAGTPPFAVFDFDNTCIVNDVGEATLAFLCQNKLVKNLELLTEGEGGAGDYSERVFRRYYEIFGQGKILEAYVFCARAFAGFTPEAATALAQATLAYEGETLGTDELYGVKIAHGLPVRPQVRQLMEYLSAQGVAIWIVSASSEFAVRAALQHHRLPGQIIGIRNVIKDGILTPLLEEPMSVLTGKPACIKKFIDPNRAPLVGVGDSMNDLPMLETASIKVIVDRGNKLAEEARARGWFLIPGAS
jgi:HAD superfamily phosphoserine phosphatase-like hydrolase